MPKVSLEDMDSDLTPIILISALGKALIKKKILTKEDVIEHIISLSHDNPNTHERNLNKILVHLCETVDKW